MQETVLGREGVFVVMVVLFVYLFYKHVQAYLNFDLQPCIFGEKMFS